MLEKSKTLLYRTTLFFAKIYWRVFRPRTRGTRILVTSQGNILLVRHRGNSAYNLPGGGIKNSEDSELGALRELYEETKLKLQNADYILGVYENSVEGELDTVTVHVAEISECNPLRHAFELSDAAWFSFNNLPPVTQATQLRMDEYLAGKRDLRKSWLL